MEKFKSVLFILIFSTLLIATISSSWSAKPIQPITEGGYARFDDSDSMAIQSDRGGIYKDCSKGGKDYVQVTYMPPNYSYLKINMVLGKMENYPDTSIISNRFIRFCFNVLGNRIDSSYINNKAVYDILRQYRDGSGYHDRSANPGFIDDDSVRAQIFASNVSGGISGVINFLVDPSPDAKCTEPEAINNEKIDLFYDDDPPNLRYTDTATYGEGGQTFYRLDFANGFDVIHVSDRTWTIEPKDGEMTLSVLKYKNKKGVSETVYLATYTAITFKITVSLDQLSGAPRKHEIATITWGNIKR